MKIFEQIQEQLAAADFKSISVSTEHLPELRRNFEKLLVEKTLKKEFYDEIVSRYGLHWHFELPVSFRTARSIIMTAVPQPKTSLQFELYGEKHLAIVPPTYIHDTDKVALDMLSPLLAKDGYKIQTALLPSKLIAVRSGLAKYGRNNIAYIDGWGSYFRLRAFFSDIPCSQDNWQEPAAMELCSKCTACINKCPTRAISADRFLVDAGQCLTFFNEGLEEFPAWIHPKWHNCLIGCMVCQDVCPANKDHTAWVMPGGDFSEEETVMILDGVPEASLPADTAQKLQKVNMLESYDLLQRNLGALIDKTRKKDERALRNDSI
jgi:epoxyqueuosine reductase